jgi:fluoroacetyl-CoA thioesterase
LSAEGSAGPPGYDGRLAAGLRATVQVVVGEADTSVAMGSGDVPVLGTPRLLALAEAAAVAAVVPYLAPGFTTVGTAVSMEHHRASPLGSDVLVEAELTAVAGTRLSFSFIARDPDEQVIGAGTHERAVVERARFLGRAAS